MFTLQVLRFQLLTHPGFCSLHITHLPLRNLDRLLSCQNRRSAVDHVRGRIITELHEWAYEAYRGLDFCSCGLKLHIKPSLLEATRWNTESLKSLLPRVKLWKHDFAKSTTCHLWSWQLTPLVILCTLFSCLWNVGTPTTMNNWAGVQSSTQKKASAVL